MSSMSNTSMSSSHPENDEEMEYELRRREMKKMHEAMGRMRKIGVAEGSVDCDKIDFDVTNMTDEDIAIVCEELWIDLKSWIGTKNNLCSCTEKALKTISRHWSTILFVIGFMIAFRWYVGAGKDACSYGVGWGVLSFVCEVMRNLGEVLLVMLVCISGFCFVLFIIIMGICFYEILNENINEDINKKEKSE